MKRRPFLFAQFPLLLSGCVFLCSSPLRQWRLDELIKSQPTSCFFLGLGMVLATSTTRLGRKRLIHSINEWLLINYWNSSRAKFTIYGWLIPGYFFFLMRRSFGSRCGGKGKFSDFPSVICFCAFFWGRVGLGLRILTIVEKGDRKENQ